MFSGSGVGGLWLWGPLGFLVEGYIIISFVESLSWKDGCSWVGGGGGGGGVELDLPLLGYLSNASRHA